MTATFRTSKTLGSIDPGKPHIVLVGLPGAGKSTVGMLLANVPVVLLGSRFASRLPLKAARIAAALVFLALGAWVALRGVG